MKVKIFYSLVFFIIGFSAVSFLKNKSRNIQKEIKELRSEINLLNQNFHELYLDYQISSSPENISYLAEKFLDLDFVTYGKHQIKKYSFKQNNSESEQ